MRPHPRRITLLGWLGVGCIAFYWLIMLTPTKAVNFGPALDVIGPFGWLILLGMVVLPIVAVWRGSRWWLAGAAAGVITCVDVLRRIH